MRDGDFRPLMTRTQRITDAMMRTKRYPIFFIDSSRRWGKTRLLVARAIQAARRRPDAIVRYCAPNKIHGRTFVMPAMQWWMKHLREEDRCRFDREDSCWIFPANNSRIYLGSADTIADCDAQVGTECDEALFDESAKVRSENLEYLHRTIILPQFATTYGTITVGSTPALSPAHYLSEMRKRAMETGGYVCFTIDDCDHITPEMRLELINEGGGPNSPSTRRELYCEHIPDRDWLVIPEWLDVRDACTVERERPRWANWYISADMGFADLSVVLFAYYDFERAKIVVWDEIAMHYASGLDVGFAVRAKEAEWNIQEPKRFADGTPQLLADLADKRHGPGLSFGLPPKDDADAALNALRMRIGAKRIEVHPRCKVLLSHLAGAIWNKSRTSYDRAGGEYGHWDAIDALKYLCRVVNWRSNPEPALLPGVSHHTHHIPEATRLQMARTKRLFT